MTVPLQVRHLVHERGRRILGVVLLEVSRIEGDLVGDLIAGVAAPLGRSPLNPAALGPPGPVPSIAVSAPVRPCGSPPRAP